MTKDQIAARRKEMELEREERKARLEDELAHATSLVTLGTSAITGIVMGVHQVRLQSVEVATAKATAFAKAFATMTEAGIPAVAAHDTVSAIFGLERPALEVIGNGQEAIAMEMEEMRARMAGLQAEAAQASSFLAEERRRREAVADSFTVPADEAAEGTQWVSDDEPAAAGFDDM